MLSPIFAYQNGQEEEGCFSNITSSISIDFLPQGSYITEYGATVKKAQYTNSS